MNNKKTIPLDNQESWDSKWPQIFEHYQQDLRHAYYIRAIKKKAEKRLLEIGAGSFRDMAALNRWGIDCYGSDYSHESVELAKKKFPLLSEKIFQLNAFQLSFEDNYFDLSYHNGLWVLFSDNDQIKEMAKEQARVTKRRIIATVHNAHNKNFADYFKKKAETDPLFQIRFFDVDEITSLLSTVSSNITIIPVGKGKRKYEDWLINKQLGSPIALKSIFQVMGMKTLKISERLLCIAEV